MCLVYVPPQRTSWTLRMFKYIRIIFMNVAIKFVYDVVGPAISVIDVRYDGQLLSDNECSRGSSLSFSNCAASCSCLNNDKVAFAEQQDWYKTNDSPDCGDSRQLSITRQNVFIGSIRCKRVFVASFAITSWRALKSGVGRSASFFSRCGSSTLIAYDARK